MVEEVEEQVMVLEESMGLVLAVEKELGEDMVLPVNTALHLEVVVEVEEVVEEHMVPVELMEVDMGEELVEEVE